MKPEHIDFFDNLKRDAYHVSCSLDVFTITMLSKDFRDVPHTALFDGMSYLLDEISQKAKEIQKQVNSLEETYKRFDAEKEITAYFKIKDLITESDDFAQLIEKQQTTNKTSDLVINMLKGVV